MSVSVKRKPVYCGACSMNITNAVRIRCAQLQPAPPPSAAGAAGSSSATGDQHAVIASAEETATRKHEPIDSLPGAAKDKGMIPTCEEFDICGSCFCEGKEVGRHKRWHDYRVVTQHAYPIFTDDWGADEELLLVSACQTFGLGNWADIAEHIGSYRTKEEVEEHYLATYINSADFPMPVTDVKLIDQDTFQARKKQRLEEAQERPVPIPPPKPLASAPTCHEIAGFMPGRLEFETEYENDAEALIKDMEFGLVHRYGGDSQPTREEAMAKHGAQASILGAVPSADARAPQASAPSGRGLGSTTAEGDGSADNAANGVGSANTTAAKGKDADGNDNSAEDNKEEVIQIWDETEDDLELKLTIMEIYNERIDRRLESKQTIFDRGLLEYKKLVAVEKKRPKEERDLLNRLKVFSKLQTAIDHEEFANGLLYEQMLRKQINDLQEYRQSGITTFAEVERYEKDKAARIATRGLGNYRDAMLLPRNTLSRPSTGATSREGTPKPAGSGTSRKPLQQPLTLSNSASLQLLTPAETRLCSELRVLPKPFLVIKQTLLREFARHGGKLGRDDAPTLFPKVIPEAIQRIWDLLFSKMLAQQDEDDGSESSDDEDDDSEGEDALDEATQELPVLNGADSSDESSEGNLMEELQELLKNEKEAQEPENGIDLEADLFGSDAGMQIEQSS